jgi:hypothetical protein
VSYEFTLGGLLGALLIIGLRRGMARNPVNLRRVMQADA